LLSLGLKLPETDVLHFQSINLSVQFVHLGAQFSDLSKGLEDAARSRRHTRHGPLKGIKHVVSPVFDGGEKTRLVKHEEEQAHNKQNERQPGSFALPPN